jgi:Glycosyltransferase family 87
VEDRVANALWTNNEHRIHRLLSAERARGWGIVVLTVFVMLMAVSFLTALQDEGQTVFGPTLGGDFPAFYVAGKLVNEQGAEQLYNHAVQIASYHELFPRQDPDAHLWYQNAPFFVAPFLLLAHLPYAWAYLCWLLLTLALYAGGFTLLWRESGALPQSAYRTALILALSFMPFLVECAAGGQTSAFGFFVLALAIVLERRGQLLASGAVLALMLYKPTLLAVIGPMILLTRRWQTLAGMTAGVAGLLALSALMLGVNVTLGWLQTMVDFAQRATSGASGAESGMKIWKYVDANAFARGIWDGNEVLRWLTAGGIVATVLWMIVPAWWRRRTEMADSREADWALAIAWTPVLNVYMGIYDVTLVVVSAVLLAALQWRRGELRAATKVLFFLLYVTPWITQPLAQATGLQLLTVVLAAFGFHVLRWRQRAGI